MSKPARVAFAVEGDTDLIMLRAAVGSLLAGREFVPTLLQPQDSEILQPAVAPTPAGWPGVYRWCQQTSSGINGSFRNDPLFENHDILVVQLDADVAGASYTSGHIQDPVKDLPCQKPCPPPEATTNPLRQALVRWMHENDAPPRTVLCTPSKALEAWVLVALYPNDRAVRMGTVECRESPEDLLSAKPAAQSLVRHGKKIVERYEDRAEDFANAWPQVRVVCSEAERFSREFLAVVPPEQ
jgi:hypothetical protein